LAWWSWVKFQENTQCGKRLQGQRLVLLYMTSMTTNLSWSESHHESSANEQMGQESCCIVEKCVSVRV